MGLLVRALCLAAVISITEANREGTGLHDYYAQLTDQKPDTENCDRWSIRVVSTRVTTFVRVTSVVLVDPSQNATAETLKDCIKLCDSRVCTAFIFYIEELECETALQFSEAGTPIRTGERDVEADSIVGFYVANEAFPVQPKCYAMTSEYAKFLEEFVNPWLYPARPLPTSPANHTTTAARPSTEEDSTSTSTSPGSSTQGTDTEVRASTTTTTERVSEKTSHDNTLPASTTATTSSQTSTASSSTVPSTSWSSDALWETLYTTLTTLTVPGEEEKTLASSTTTTSSSTTTSSGPSTSSSATVASSSETSTSATTSTSGAKSSTASQTSPTTTTDASTTSSRSTTSTASSSRATTSSSTRDAKETTSSSTTTTTRTTRRFEEPTTTPRFDCVVNITGWKQIKLRDGENATKEIDTEGSTKDLNGTITGETIKYSFDINETASDSPLNDTQYDWNITFSSFLPGCRLNISMEDGSVVFRGPNENETVNDDKDSLNRNISSVQCLCDRSSNESVESTESAESTPTTTSSSRTVTSEPSSSSAPPTMFSDESDSSTTASVTKGLDAASEPAAEPTTVSSTDSTSSESAPISTTTKDGRLYYAGQIIVDNVPYLVPVNGVFSEIYIKDLPLFKESAKNDNVEVVMFPACSITLKLIGRKHVHMRDEVDVPFGNVDGNAEKHRHVNFAANGYSGFASATGSCQMGKVGKSGPGYEN